jgi:pimeloyl-ACP methyl ester carboxylesterase
MQCSSVKSGGWFVGCATLSILSFCLISPATTAIPDGMLLFPDYAPLRTGTTLEYRLSASDGTQFTYKSSVESPNMWGTALVYPVRLTPSIGDFAEVHYYSSDNVLGWQEHGLDWIDPPCGFRYAPPRRVPSGLSPGQMFSQRVVITPTAEPCGSGVDQVTTTFEGFETVTVPAGTFENCARVTSITTGDFDYTTTYYLARDVGAVKVVDNGEGGTTISELLSRPSLFVVLKGAKMVDSHTLEIGVEAEFSQSSATEKSIEIQATINGTSVPPVSVSSNEMVGQQSKLIYIDLKAKNVPRFVDNDFPQITAKAKENGMEASDQKRVAILLPVIIVPGILSSPEAFSILKGSLVEKSAFDLLSSGYLGQGYALGTASSSYPTIFTLNYDYNGDSFARAASRLRDQFASVKSKTYADKVNLIGYSKGGLVARQYLVGNPGEGLESGAKTVARMIMAVVPNLGSLEAAWEKVLPGGRFLNLSPVWPWVRENNQQYFRVAPPNPQLSALNAIPLPKGIDYTLLYSESDPTVATRTGIRNWRRFNEGRLYEYTYEPGDGVVPAFSILGEEIDPNNPNNPPQVLPGFEQVCPECRVLINHNHLGYLDFQPVIDEIYRRLIEWPE